MSARRVLAGSAIALLRPASLLMTTEIGSASDTGTSASDQVAAKSKVRTKQRRQRITLEAMPQIVDQGRRTTAADKAHAAFTATIRPRRTGRPVVLQVKRGSGWKTVDRDRLDRKGRAEFSAKASRRGEALTYRVQAARYRGLGKVKSAAVDTERWLTPTWTDEFSGRELSDFWSHRGQDYEKESLRMCSKGDPKAVKVRRGAVRLSVLKDKSRNGKCKARENGRISGKYAYRLNGHIGTQNKFEFKYGFAAARVKFHKQRGQHGSFWMQPGNGSSDGDAGHEIDVIEYFGDKHPRGGLTSFIYRPKGKSYTKTGSWIRDSRSFLKNRRDGWSKNYHVFSVEWTPNRLIFRIDGKESWRVSGRISDNPQYPILSLLASDYELSNMKDRQLPQHMYVDWIRVWETPRG